MIPPPKSRITFCLSTAPDRASLYEPSLFGASQDFQRPDSEDSIIALDETDSDATIDNDPEYRYYVRDALDVVRRKQRVCGTQSPAAQGQKVVEAIDLTSDLEGDFITDADVARLAPTLRPNDKPELAQPDIQRACKRIVTEICVGDIIYKTGQSLELHDGSFIRVMRIMEDSTGVSFRGRRLFKLTHMARMEDPRPYFPRWPKELVWVVNDDFDVPLGAIRRVTTIRFTNHIRPDQEHRVPNLKQFFCRLKEDTDTVLGQVRIEYLSRDEADEGYWAESWELRQQWRGRTRLFGSSDKKPSNTPVVIDVDPHNAPAIVDLTAEETIDAMISKLVDRRQYTFGDGFCGAGGMSSGAQKAGLRLKWAFDKSPHVVETYQLNFPDAVCKAQDVYDFLTGVGASSSAKVDICHGSPPCQTFSAAHTVESVNDEANYACIFACADSVKKVKPRVFTIEETSGLFEMNEHKGVFCRLIQSLLEIGYSVGWGILHCQCYGVPQKRRRLITIASGPGETLPSFPKPTHGPPDSGLLGYKTINSMISNIPRGSANHDVEKALLRGQRRVRRHSYDAHQPAKTITTGGGEANYHPSGKRGYTNREFACLQTFDVDYRFGRRGVRKQIGNAVPPVMAKAIYREIIRSLRRTDQAEAVEIVNRGNRTVDAL